MGNHLSVRSAFRRVRLWEVTISRVSFEKSIRSAFRRVCSHGQPFREQRVSDRRSVASTLMANHLWVRSEFLRGPLDGQPSHERECPIGDPSRPLSLMVSLSPRGNPASHLRWFCLASWLVMVGMDRGIGSGLKVLMVHWNHWWIMETLVKGIILGLYLKKHLGIHC